MYSSNGNSNSNAVKSASFDDKLARTTTYSYPDKDAGWWMIYKLTASIATGTTTETGNIIKKYLYDVVTEEALGCDTYKQSMPAMFHQEILGDLFQQGQLHFVDSDIFQTRGATLTDIVNYIDSLGAAEMNEFWHNKIQLYAVDFVEHYTAIYEASLEGGELENRVQFRLSEDADGVAVAHVAFMLKTAGQVYEIVGPASSLSKEQLSASFTRFASNECMAAQVASLTMTEAESLYNDYYTSRSTDNEPQADGATYKYPIVLSMTIPVSTSDFRSITTNINVFDDVINVYGSHETQSFEYDDYTCMIQTLSIDGIDSPVRYVYNSAVASTVTAEYDHSNTLIKYSVASWEKDILQSHTDLLNGGNSVQWDRYLDTHIGMQYFQYATTIDSTYCNTQSNAIKTSILDHGQNYAIKTTSDNGQHFYTGSQGLKAIEYNTISCFAQTEGVASVCGCNAINNDVVYEAHMGLSECMGATVKDYSTTIKE